MTQSKAISQARQAMLDLIKGKASTNNRTSKNKTGGASSSGTQQIIRKKVYIDIPTRNQFKRELDQMRRPAYTVILNGKMI